MIVFIHRIGLHFEFGQKVSFFLLFRSQKSFSAEELKKKLTAHIHPQTHVSTRV